MIDYNYLDLLNSQQRNAVTYCDGPQLVIAGAGSGKTRVLTYKIVHLLVHGYSPERILALTFTNKAAGEMKQRIANVVGGSIASKIKMGTFHSVFLRILRKHAEILGYKSSFSIYDAADSKALVKNIIKELGLDDKKYRPSTIAAIISNAKNDLVTPNIYENDQDRRREDELCGRGMTYRIFKEYALRCRAAQVMDFDDILLNMNILLRDNDDIRNYYQDYFQYILVDEYQDTNFAQHLSVSLLCNKENHLCVVGDDAQSIYSFRGANIDNILLLNSKYKNLRIDKLEQNYRSTQNIIDAASSLISKNKRQMHKNVYSRNAVGEKIELLQAYSDLEEARAVANKIITLRNLYHDSYDDYAVLYRTNAQSRVLEEELRRMSIGYRIHGGISFYQRKEVKSAICYFRLAINPNDDQAIERVINYPARGIGKTTFAKLSDAATKNNVSIWQVLDNPDKYPIQINAGTKRKLSNFHSIIQAIVDENEKTDSDAYSVAQIVYNRSEMLLGLSNDKTPEAISQKENLEELLAGAKIFVDRQLENDNNASMVSFLSEIALATDLDEEDTVTEVSGKVTMMTIHASKGLEYKHVFIVGLEEDLFPATLSSMSESGIEEERRLFYVAITRAMETCNLSFAASRFRNGQTVNQKPSRFLYDIDRKYLSTGYAANIINASFKSKPWLSRNKEDAVNRELPKFSATTSVAKASSAASTHTINEVKEGMCICHLHFGNGKIVSTNPQNQSIEVDFEQGGLKKLLLKFAKFDIL